MTSQSNTYASLIAVAIIAAVVVLAGTVWAMRSNQADRGASVSAPGVKFEQRGGDVKIEAPYTSIQKDRNGTRIQAPGVDIELPPKQAD